MHKYNNLKMFIYRRICSYLLLLIFIAAGFFSLKRNIDKENKKEISCTINQEERSQEEECFYAEAMKTQMWNGPLGTSGAEFRITCFNNTGYNITNWHVTMEIPEGSSIDTGWNGTYEIQGNTLIYTPDQNTETIFTYQPRTFGFILYTPMKYEIQNITITGYERHYLNETHWYWILVLAAGITFIGMFFSILTIRRERMFQRKSQEDRNLIVQVMKTFSNFIDAKDPYTKGHSERVATYVLEIARRMGKSEDERNQLYYMALLHDVGKIGIPDNILNKPGKLTESERSVIQTHTILAEVILKDFNAIPNMLDGAKYHHERYDGKGYPAGLSGTSIPECARIICIADSYDAMSSDRCYRPKLPKDVILDEFVQCSGTQFDPEIACYMTEYLEEKIAMDKKNMPKSE